MNHKFPRIILASASPRRAALLRQAGFAFEILPSQIDESPPARMPPLERVQWAAREKARAVSQQVDSGMIIGADTLVVQEERVFGKPRDLAEAREMLRRLSGRRHEVLTGVTLLQAETRREDTWATVTAVYFRPLSEEEITWYLRSGEPLDKAGAYGIQARAGGFVARIEGCYFNVVGLPLADLIQHLAAWVGAKNFSP